MDSYEENTSGINSLGWFPTILKLLCLCKLNRERDDVVRAIMTDFGN